MRCVTYTILALMLGVSSVSAQQGQGLQGGVTPQGLTPGGAAGAAGQGLQGVQNVPSVAGQILQRRGGAGPSQHFLQNQAASQNPIDILETQQALQNQQFRQQGARPNVDFKNRDPSSTPVLDELRRDQAVQNQETHGNSTDLTDALLVGSGGYAGGSVYGPSTIPQSLQSGAAEIIRSTGQYNRDTAAAEVLHEKAREEFIDNRYQAVDNYFQVRALNQKWQQHERGPQPTQADAYRYSKSGVPQRLSTAELDRISGQIRWPAVLAQPMFADHRARLEQIFQARSYYQSGIASQSYVEAKQESDAMLATLKDFVRQIDPMAYIQARNFIESLGFEAQFVASNEGVALR